jgi:hypothetical protein
VADEVVSSYVIVDGNTDGAFAIAIDGVITVAEPTALDADAPPNAKFTLSVAAIDANHRRSDTVAMVTIALVDVTERPVLDLPADRATPIDILAAEAGEAGSVLIARIGVLNADQLAPIQCVAVLRWDGDGGDDGGNQVKKTPDLFAGVNTSYSKQNVGALAPPPPAIAAALNWLTASISADGTSCAVFAEGVVLFFGQKFAVLLRLKRYHACGPLACLSGCHVLTG